MNSPREFAQLDGSIDVQALMESEMTSSRQVAQLAGSIDTAATDGYIDLQCRDHNRYHNQQFLIHQVQELHQVQDLHQVQVLHQVQGLLALVLLHYLVQGRLDIDMLR